MWRRNSIGTMEEVPSAAAGVNRFSQNQNRCALDGNAGEGSRAPRPGVDVDSVMPDIGMWHRRMAVNDEHSVVLYRVEELVTNPEQILESLLLDRDARANTGMYKQEIAAIKTIVETLQEQFVCTRKGAAKAAVQLDFSFDHPRARIYPVGCKGMQAAQLQPRTKVGRPPKEILHQSFVITMQAHCAIFDKP